MGGSLAQTKSVLKRRKLSFFFVLGIPRISVLNLTGYEDGRYLDGLCVGIERLGLVCSIRNTKNQK